MALSQAGQLTLQVTHLSRTVSGEPMCQNQGDGGLRTDLGGSEGPSDLAAYVPPAGPVSSRVKGCPRRAQSATGIGDQSALVVGCEVLRHAGGPADVSPVQEGSRVGTMPVGTEAPYLGG